MVDIHEDVPTARREREREREKEECSVKLLSKLKSFHLSRNHRTLNKMAITLALGRSHLSSSMQYTMCAIVRAEEFQYNIPALWYVLELAWWFYRESFPEKLARRLPKERLLVSFHSSSSISFSSFKNVFLEIHPNFLIHFDIRTHFDHQHSPAKHTCF